MLKGFIAMKHLQKEPKKLVSQRANSAQIDLLTSSLNWFVWVVTIILQQRCSSNGAFILVRCLDCLAVSSEWIILLLPTLFQGPCLPHNDSSSYTDLQNGSCSSMFSIVHTYAIVRHTCAVVALPVFFTIFNSVQVRILLIIMYLWKHSYGTSLNPNETRTLQV